jgi:uncharacterized protein YqjF (DUF2071 family)
MSASLAEERIDRIAPTRRPSGMALMRQRWRRLLFLHWPVPAERVRARVPAGLDVDTHEGQAWIGLVPFVVEAARPVFAPPLPFVSWFDEVNVRTYVHARGRDPGVWFFSLDASSRVAVAAARALFKLAYRFAEMRADVEGGTVRFQSRRIAPGPLPGTCAMRYAPRGPVAHAVPGTLEHFLVERYVLYAADGERLFQGRVHHAAYPVQPATVEDLREDLVAAAGLSRPAVAPLAHYASGVDVEVFPLRREAGDGRPPAPRG